MQSFDAVNSPVLEFYKRTMRLLTQNGVPYLVGGAHALSRYADMRRVTKDFDMFIKKQDLMAALNAVASGGYRTELTDPHWLAKAFDDESYVDFIFNSANGVATVDDEWFTYAVSNEVFGVPALLVAPEEMIWSKAFVMERDRFDGADIVHIIHSLGDSLNWKRLLDRFADNWPVLFIYIIYFGFIYPSDKDRIPDWLTKELLSRFAQESRKVPQVDKVCRGTLFSSTQYMLDLSEWGYLDGRLNPPSILPM